MAIEDDPETPVMAADEQTYEHELTEGQSPSEAVYTTVAAATNTEPLGLSPLAEAVDTDALDRLHDSRGGGDVRTTFEYVGLLVTVDGETVSLRGDLANVESA